jgi:DNA invertase Pin-like site-specific DNA recombinase
MSHPKVRPTHLNRSAVIYVRQSSPQAVEQHAESRRRQYQLVGQAQQLGWKAAECTVIDDDQGISGAQSYNRPGYQRLVSMLALREVGIVLGLEVSRLARNSLDWYQLLELAAAFDVLIADEDGVYDPSEFNDRLLLGLKGTISEVELYQIRCRMVRGRLNKVRRGEFALNLPVGMDWDPATNRPRLAVDQSVRHALALVFHSFGQWHSIRGVLYYFREGNLELPFQRLHRGLGRQIGWRRPSYDALYSILTNPVYVGVYCYGRRERQIDPITKTAHVRKRVRSAWEVFLPDHHPGYISLAEFEENQRILENNQRQFPQSQGASGRGPALLQGLVFCQHCGRRMRIRYRKGSAYYVCDAAHRRYGDPICNRASTQRVDVLVEELFLSVINADTLALSISYAEKLRQEAQGVDRVWQERLQRLEYEANLARRRYELVDPENRLVAQTLETEWNERLLVLEETKKTYEAQRVTSPDLQSTLGQMQRIISHLPEYWYADSLSMEDRKDLLRCLVEQVFLESRGKVIRAYVNWYGGAVSELDVPKYLFSAPHIYHRIRDLSGTHTDAEIAATLNQEGVKTVKGRLWTARRVMDFRLSNAIPSGFTMSSEFRLTDSGYISSAEAAAQLGVSQSTIQNWYRLGVLSGKQDSRQSPLWIHWTDDVTYRLGGGATPDPRMVSVRSLCGSQGKRPDQVLAWAQASGHTIYRLRRNSAMRFYIVPGESSIPRE